MTSTVERHVSSLDARTDVLPLHLGAIPATPTAAPRHGVPATLTPAPRHDAPALPTTAQRHGVPAPSYAPRHRTAHALPMPTPAAPAGLGPMVPAPVPPRPTMRWGWLALGLVAAVLAVATLAAFAAAHRTMTVNGVATVRGYSTLTPGTGCSKPSENGTTVSIYDASGDLVGSAMLSGEGTAVSTGTGSSSYSSYADGCRMSFTATNVSAGSDFYRITVGSRDSQGVSFSRDQLASGQAGVVYSS